MPKKILTYSLRTLLRLTKLALMLSMLAVITISLNSSRIPSTLESIKESGKLVVISRNGPTTYFEGNNGYTGFEYVLAKKFADHLGVELEIKETEDLGRMLDSVGTQDGHFAAAGLTVTNKRLQKVQFSSPYLQITQQLVYRAGEKRPASVQDVLGKKILIIANSSHAERLRELQRQYPQLVWEERSDIEMLDLLEMVHSGKIDHTIVDSNAYDINRTLYPRAKRAFDISEPQDLAWAFPIQKDKSLFQEAQKFFEKVHENGYIKDTLDTFYGHVGEIEYGGALVFTKRLETRLPKWREALQAAAEHEGLDWQLLAALSYQESHWNPKAKSRTGVRGFMMLTKDTAKDMGVKNRLNAMQSIKGGAKYFKKIHTRIPKRIAEPDRTWLALAAYNIGLGHVEDARIITEHQGGNPDKWTDVMERLPLLAKRKYYKFTRRGYARGWEAVDYVQNIRNFRTIIAWNEMEKDRLHQLAANESRNNEFATFSPVVMEAVKQIATSSL